MKSERGRAMSMHNRTWTEVLKNNLRIKAQLERVQENTLFDGDCQVNNGEQPCNMDDGDDEMRPLISVKTDFKLY